MSTHDRAKSTDARRLTLSRETLKTMRVRSQLRTGKIDPGTTIPPAISDDTTCVSTTPIICQFKNWLTIGCTQA